MSDTMTRPEIFLPSSEEALHERFGALARVWRNETRYLSSSNAIAMHPAYQQIIGMGPAAIPLLLRELAREPAPWFWALKAISGFDPVPEEKRGDREAMTRVWLQWGESQGYLL